jgi:predicted NAD/FAD-binding protein
MKIAVVGGGISGLASAFWLGNRHAVTLYEAAPRLGGHANTVEVAVDGRSHAVDTGFIVYNEATYPEFTRLLEALRVPTQAADMSFGLSCERSGVEWSSRGLAGVFASPANALRPAFVRMLREILRFAREAPALLAGRDAKVTIRDFLVGGGYSDAFRDWYVVPMGAAIWSAGSDDLLEMPAASFVRFFSNHGLLGRGGDIRWRTVSGGSRSYVEALTARLRATVRCGSPVARVERGATGPRVVTAEGAERFDRVILSVHSDTALRLLAAPTETERRVLGSIRYSPNETVLHTDVSLLPRRRRARASWNYLAPRERGERVLVTYDLTRLQRIPSARRLLVTLNGGNRIAPARVLGRFQYAHPILDGAAIRAQALHGEIDGGGGVHFCGAYWGFGFHEDGLQSGLRVCRALEAVRWWRAHSTKARSATTERPRRTTASPSACSWSISTSPSSIASSPDAGCGASSGARSRAFGAPITSATPPSRSKPSCETSSPRAPATAQPVRSACSRICAMPATSSIPSASSTASRRPERSRQSSPT